jgi:threonine dehydratase
MPSSRAFRLPTAADVEAAAVRLRGEIVTTPLLESPVFNEKVGGRLLVKAEMFQRTGSYKFRGAFNRLSRLDGTERRRGVVAYSSGNHAQGVAAAARALDIPALIVMPRGAPTVKVEGTRSHGAEVVFYDEASEKREEVAARLAGERGATLVRPYEDAYVVAGQGTVGLELVAQAGAAQADLDAVLVPCGGGGLVAGTALVLANLCPAAELWAVEPQEFDDTRRSLAAGERLEIAPGAKSFCDALRAPTPGEMTFALNRRLLAGGLAVNDATVAVAMREAFTHLKIVAEPGGAVALAAALSGAFDCRGKVVGVVCSGGNVDPETFAGILSS